MLYSSILSFEIAFSEPDPDRLGSKVSAKIISFEGIDGVGKTTQLQCLSAALFRLDRPHISTQELGGDAIRDNARNILMQDLTAVEELSLISLIRGYHMRKIINPALNQGKLVLIDRFIDSTYAYQGGGRGLKTSLIEFMEQNIWGTPKPDLTIYLDLEPKHSPKRDRFEKEDHDFFNRVRDAYLERMDNRWLWIQDGQNEISDIILKKVIELLD